MIKKIFNPGRIIVLGSIIEIYGVVGAPGLFWHWFLMMLGGLMVVGGMLWYKNYTK